MRLRQTRPEWCQSWGYPLPRAQSERRGVPAISERVKAREVDAVSLLDAYLHAVSVVIDAVDRLEK